MAKNHNRLKICNRPMCNGTVLSICRNVIFPNDSVHYTKTYKVYVLRTGNHCVPGKKDLKKTIKLRNKSSLFVDKINTGYEFLVSIQSCSTVKTHCVNSCGYRIYWQEYQVKFITCVFYRVCDIKQYS